MKVLQRIGKVFLCICMVFSLTAPIFATQSAVSDTQSRAILRKMGIPDSIINIMPVEDQLQHIEMFLNAPNQISVQTDTLQVDPLREIQGYLEMSHQQKLLAGLSEERIEQVDTYIEHLQIASDEELKSLGIPADEIPLYRSVLSGNSVVPYGEGDVTESELDFTVIVYDTPDAFGPSVDVFIYFTWLDTYVTYIFDDKVVVAWGGDLVLHEIDSYVQYYYCNPLDGWGSSYHSDDNPRDIPYHDSIVDGDGSAGYYEFEQSITPNILAKAGRITFELSQSGLQNKEAAFVTYFAHQVTAIDDITITISRPISVDISFGTGYDTTNQVREIITY